MKKVFQFTLFFFFLFSSALAQHFSIESSVDRRSALIGDKIKYRIDLQFKEGLKVMKPGPGTDLGAFEIKDFEILSTSVVKDIVFHSIIYTIAAYEVGRFVLPAAEAIAVINGSNVTLKSRPININIKSSLGDGPNASPSLKDIKLPSKTEGKIPQRYFIYLGIIIFVLMLMILLWKFKNIFLKPSPPKPPYLVAFDDINDLISFDHLRKSNFKPFYYALSMIVRRYLEQSQGITSTTQTTRQINKQIEKSSIENAKLYIDLFKYADRVKFSTFIPSLEKTNKIVMDVKEQLLKDKKKIEQEMHKKNKQED